MANGDNSGITLTQIRNNGKKYVKDDTTMSADIKAVQSALRMMGYWGSPNDPDGAYGDYSVAAVRGLQNETGLAVNGNLDKAALAKIEGFAGTLSLAHSKTPTIAKISKGLDYAQQGDSGSAIQTISNYLKNQGYLTVTKTTFDSAMYTAVGKFQSDMGLKKDYSVGLATYVTLMNPSASNWFANSKVTLTAGMLARCGFNGQILLSTMVAKLNSAINAAGCNTKEKAKHFLTQVCVETSSGWSVVEKTYKAGTGIAGKSYSPYAGAGFLQLTSKANYQTFHDKSKPSDSHLITPDTYATQHCAIAYPGDSAAWFWSYWVVPGVSSWTADADTIGKQITGRVLGDSSGWTARKPFYTKINGVLK